MAEVKTVKVKAPTKSGFIIINEEDFDSNVHKKFVPPRTPLKKEGEGTEGDTGAK